MECTLANCEWLPEFDSALIIYDMDGGYRRFLGADPESALRLADLCTGKATLEASFVVSAEITSLNGALVEKIAGASSSPLPANKKREEKNNALAALTLPPPETPTRFFPQMLDWAVEEIRQLLALPDFHPSDIVILAPYLSDALRFSLSTRLDKAGIPWRSHRPSRSLRDEPASHCLLTLAELAHPGWGVCPTKFDVAYALLYAIEGMDLVRAQLLTEIVYRAKDITLSTFEQIKPEVQERITFLFGTRFAALRDWLLAYREETPQPFDHFLRRLFGEILSQQGFGFHRNFDGARTAASLIESIQKFRQAMEPAEADLGDLELGKEYIQMLQDGVISAQYLEAWQTQEKEAVLLAPAYTFLMMNRPATVQFWLDVGSGGWWERLFQPLTQPYVLSRLWGRDHQWTDADDLAANQQTLARLVSGLLRRCKSRVYLGLSDLGEAGFEQRGPLLKAIWKIQLENQIQNEN